MDKCKVLKGNEKKAADSKKELAPEPAKPATKPRMKKKKPEILEEE